jgi:hypothetical protein
MPRVPELCLNFGRCSTEKGRSGSHGITRGDQGSTSTTLGLVLYHHSPSKFPKKPCLTSRGLRPPRTLPVRPILSSRFSPTHDFFFFNSRFYDGRCLRCKQRVVKTKSRPCLTLITGCCKDVRRSHRAYQGRSLSSCWHSARTHTPLAAHSKPGSYPA